jgi:cell fate (sporulation/competence/biofilm development) regulator YlbF (YheA/YmcA/DUF963 family)
MKKSTHHRILGGLGALALIGAAASMSVGSATALDHHGDDTNKIRIGTFQPQTAFESYHGAAAMNERMMELQQQMQEAQQQGDQQALMDAQMRMQQLQNEVIEQFYADLEEAMPDVAKEANVKIVAVDVVYTDDSIGEAKDITEHIVKHLNNDEPDEQRDAVDAPW